MKYFFVLFFLIICTTANAAVLPAEMFAADKGHNVADTDTVIRKMSATVGVSYGSDVQFFGRTGPITYPFVSVDAIYNAKNGLFVYASSLKVLGYNPFFDEIDLGGGYLFKLSKKLTNTISYTRFLFNKDAAEIIKSASSNDINLNNSYNFGFVKTNVVFDYLFGQESDFFTTFSISKYLESKFSIFDEKDYLTINPNVSAIFGTQNFVQKYSLDHSYRLDADNLFADDPGGPHLGNSNGTFKALNYSFKIPIAYNRPHYTLEFSYKYSIPVNVEGILQNHHEGFYNLTFYYVFY